MMFGEIVPIVSRFQPEYYLLKLKAFRFELPIFLVFHLKSNKQKQKCYANSIIEVFVDQKEKKQIDTYDICNLHIVDMRWMMQLRYYLCVNLGVNCLPHLLLTTNPINRMVTKSPYLCR